MKAVGALLTMMFVSIDSWTKSPKKSTQSFSRGPQIHLFIVHVLCMDEFSRHGPVYGESYNNKDYPSRLFPHVKAIAPGAELHQNKFNFNITQSSTKTVKMITSFSCVRDECLFVLAQ